MVANHIATEEGMNGFVGVEMGELVIDGMGSEGCDEGGIAKVEDFVLGVDMMGKGNDVGCALDCGE